MRPSEAGNRLFTLYYLLSCLIRLFCNFHDLVALAHDVDAALKLGYATAIEGIDACKGIGMGVEGDISNAYRGLGRGAEELKTEIIEHTPVTGAHIG